MSGSLVRTRYAAVAVKIETTPGTDAIAGSPAAGDWFGGTCEVSFDQNTTPNDELTGSLDRAADLPGGLRPNLTIRTPLRGSGAPGTAPEFGRLLQCCTMVQTITAAAIGAPTAATAGTDSGATLASPFAATAQLYRGMPLLVSGAHTAVGGVVDYTTGRVASLGQTFNPVLSTTDLFQIPANVLYSTTSDEGVQKAATVYLYMDGIRWRFTGAVGTMSLEMSTGGICFLRFTLRAQLAAPPDTVAVPAGALAVTRPTPPRFVNGLCQLGRQTAQVRQATIDLGVNTVLPDNPEALEGFDAAVAIERRVGGTLDPLMSTTSYVALFNNFRSGTQMPFQAVVGTTPGNRFLVTVPSARQTANNPGNRDGLGTNQISFQAEGADSSFFLAAF
jgi:hypothetical protein